MLGRTTFLLFSPDVPLLEVSMVNFQLVFYFHFVIIGTTYRINFVGTFHCISNLFDHSAATQEPCVLAGRFLLWSYDHNSVFPSTGLSVTLHGQFSRCHLAFLVTQRHTGGYSSPSGPRLLLYTAL